MIRSRTHFKLLMDTYLVISTASVELFIENKDAEQQLGRTQDLGAAKHTKRRVIFTESPLCAHCARHLCVYQY
jgi:hypothetical protein